MFEEELKKDMIPFQQEKPIYDIEKAIPPYQPTEPTDDIKSILEQNRNIPFINRMFTPGAPSIINPDGSVSSHLLEWGEQGGKYYVYPSLVEQNGKLIQQENPFEHAFNTGNFVELADKDMAIRLASGAWKQTVSKQEKPIYDIEKATPPSYQPEEPDELKIEKPSFWERLGESYKRLPYEQPPTPAPAGFEFMGKMAPAATRLTQPSFWKEAIPKLWEQFKGFATQEFPDITPVGMALKPAKKALIDIPIQKEQIRRGAIPSPAPSVLEDIKKTGITIGEFALWFPKTIYKFLDDPTEFIEEHPLDAVFLATLVLGKGAIKRRKKGEPTKLEPETIGELTDRLLAPLEGGIDPAFMLAAEQKVISTLFPARMLAGKQKAIYTAERAKKFAAAEAVGRKVKGEAGFYAQIAELKGEMQRMKFESIRNKLTQAELDAMFQKVTDSPALTYKESIAAGKGLGTLFGEFGGRVPQPKQIALLSRVFSREFIQTILSKQSAWVKVRDVMLETASVPRAMMASFDLSFGFRQGIFLMARYPKEFFPAFAAQFKFFRSEKAYQTLMETITKHPDYPLALRGGLPLTKMDVTLALREEAFLGGRIAEKIPAVGLGIRASNRAYTGYANKLRFDVFTKMVEKARKAGHKPGTNERLLESMCDFIGTASGRGSIKMFERSAVTLNALLFSPRLMSSRLKLLWPGYYMKLHPFVRRQALQSLFSFAGMGVTVISLAKLAGCEVGVNPLSADFGKIKIGNTRIDIWGGFQPYVRTVAQFIAGKTVSTTTGKVTKTGEGYKPLTRPGILGRGAEYKLSPVASFAYNLLRGSTAFGEKIEPSLSMAPSPSVGTEIAQRFVPMVIQDIVELAKDDPDIARIFGFGALGIVGVGLQTYKPKEKRTGYWK